MTNRLLWDVFEVRVLGTTVPGWRNPHTEAGYFDYEHIDQVPAAIEALASYAGVYVTLNPVNPALLARTCNRLAGAQRAQTTSDTDILRRRWLFLDIDPVRPSGISATESEKQGARETAARLQDWHVDLLAGLRPKQMFFAYDTPDDLEPLIIAGRKLIDAGFTVASHALRCYVLNGYPRDTFDAAEARLIQTTRAGFTPMAMLWRDATGNTTPEWRRFQRVWARPALIHSAALAAEKRKK